MPEIVKPGEENKAKNEVAKLNVHPEDKGEPKLVEVGKAKDGEAKSEKQ